MIMAFAMFCSVLQPMAAKAMDIIKDKGLEIVRSMPDKAKDIIIDKAKDIANKAVDKAIVNIERDISKLQTILCMIQDIVQVAEEKQIDKQGKPTVFIQNWLRDLVDIGYDARDVLDDFITFSSCVITEEEASNRVNFISSFILSYVGGLSSGTSNIPLAILNRLAKDIRNVTERFDKMKEEGETFTKLKSVVGGGGSESVRVDRRPEVGPFINKQRDGLFLGREEVKQGIMEKILHPSDDNTVRVVAIWGMGGIGKTTLAQSIYNDERVKEVPRSWLFVGENKFSAKKVIREILNDKETTGIENLQTKLKEKLSGNRFLIVLDDVWDVGRSEWDSLFNPLTNDGNGGLIIITTRRIGPSPKFQTTYCLMPLSKEDSWSLFESCAYKDGKSDSSTSEQKRIGEEIVKKLNGLPLALKVVGQTLLEKDSSTWTNFLESNDWTLIDDDDTDNDINIMSALRWSYNHLPRHLKTCFTYCALFPKDHEFNKKLLVQMWMAHDLIQKEKQKPPEDVGAQYFEQLVNASLLQCVDGKHVMHDLIHDLALLVSNGEFATANSSLTNDQMKKVRHITITRGDYSKIPRLFQMEKLLTLYTICSDEEDPEGFDYSGTICSDEEDPEGFDYSGTICSDEEDPEGFDYSGTICSDEEVPKGFDYSVLDDVFKKLKSIRVLVLDSSKITEIPDCISELRHLRYLDVSNINPSTSCHLPDSLCRLYNLQMLAVPHHAELPKDIVNMVNLRYLRANLSTCKGVGKLTSLQELSFIYVCRGDNIRELGNMQRLRGELRIHGLQNVTSSEDAAGASMEKQTLMDELGLAFSSDSEKPSISHEEVLDALGCPPNLKCLSIYCYAGVKSPSWMVDGKHKFGKLQKLNLSNCSNWESLPPLGELTSLKDLYLTNVGVKRLGDEFYGKFTDGKVFFPSLESLRFTSMEEWEEWDDIIIQNSSVSFFPCLTKLAINRCPKLVSVLRVVMNAANFMTSLSSLEISDCERLRSLPADSLPPLTYLQINRCPLLYERCRDWHKFGKLQKLRLTNCSNWESLPPLGELTSLKHLYLANVGVKRLGDEFYGKITDGKVFFPSLESLSFSFMKEWEEWDDDIIIENSSVSFFPRLTTLEISDCKRLRSLPADGFPPSIRRLSIIKCPLLYERCKDESGPDWHKIKHIRYKDIRQQFSLDDEINFYESLSFP